MRQGRLLNEIHVANNGRDALRLAGGDVRPGIILLDLYMPGMGGLAVLGVLKSNPATSMVPVVILTGSDNVRDMEQAHRLGARAFVQKPITFRDYSRIVEQLGMPWLMNLSTPEH